MFCFSDSQSNNKVLCTRYAEPHRVIQSRCYQVHPGARGTSRNEYTKVLAEGTGTTLPAAERTRTGLGKPTEFEEDCLHAC